MPSYAFLHNEFVPMSEAKISVMTHCLHYGTAIFEGIRGNWNSEHKQIYLFRLREHYERLFNGCRVLNINLKYSIDELCQITIDLISKSGFEEDVYIRPLAYKSSESLGVRLHDLEDGKGGTFAPDHGEFSSQRIFSQAVREMPDCPLHGRFYLVKDFISIGSSLFVETLIVIDQVFQEFVPDVRRHFPFWESNTAG